MPPVTISPSGRVPGRVSEPSRSRVGNGGGLGRIYGKVIGYREFSGRRQFLGERATREGSGGVMTHKYRGSQQSSREVKPKFIDSTQGEPKNIYKP